MKKLLTALLALTLVLSMAAPLPAVANAPIGDWIWVITQPYQPEIPEVPETPAVPPTYETTEGAWWYASTSCPEMFPTLADWEAAIMDPTWPCNIFDDPSTSWTPVYVPGETIQTHPGYPAIPGTPAVPSVPEQGHWYNTVTGETYYGANPPVDNGGGDEDDCDEDYEDCDDDTSTKPDPGDGNDNNDTGNNGSDDNNDNNDLDTGDNVDSDDQTTNDNDDNNTTPPTDENNNNDDRPMLPQTGSAATNASLIGVALANIGAVTAVIKRSKRK